MTEIVKNAITRYNFKHKHHLVVEAEYKMKKRNYLLVILIGLLAYGLFTSPAQTNAVPQTFTVNSVNDGFDANPGNGICETSTSGECTLRAAVEEANSNGNPLDQDVVAFNIPGAGMHTINLGSSISISESVLINAYTEPGASANTNLWPADLNGTLLIELVASTSSVFNVGASNSTIRGLVINNSADTLIQLFGGPENTKIEGNYLNTDASGLVAAYGAGGFAIASGPGTGDITIGGSNAEARNVISARRLPLNLGSLDTNAKVVIKGNNVGIGSDSVTPLPNIDLGAAMAGITGGSDHEIGGSQPGEGNYFMSSIGGDGLAMGAHGGASVKGNIFSDNFGHGLTLGVNAIGTATQDTIIGGITAPEKNLFIGNGGRGLSIVAETGVTEVLDTTVIGNNFGVDSDGQTAVGNDTGIEVLGDVSRLVIGGDTAAERNIISANTSSGISIAGGTGSDLTIQGNFVGTESDGVTPLANGGDALSINSSSMTGDIQIGGVNVGEGNVLSGNDVRGIWLTGAGTAEVTVQGNYIGVGSDGVTAVPNAGTGLLAEMPSGLIGGVNANETNIIANNGGSGVAISGDPSTWSVLGNYITNNANLGIDINNNGVTQNDENDPDSGANDILNFPVLNFPTEVGLNTDITYTLDVPAGDYRVEFYSNTAADSSGYGEGETIIGSDVVTSLGAGSQQFTATVNGTGHLNVSATVTEINVLRFSGFGPTSEFSAVAEPAADVEVQKTVVDQDTITTNGTLAYEITLTNQGPDALDLTQFNTVDPGDPLNSALFNDLFPDTTFTFASVDGDADCSTQNDSATFGTLFSNNADTTVLSCSYSGSDTTLASGASLQFTLNFNVAASDRTIFNNYVFSVPTTIDDDYQIFQDAISSGNDITDQLIGNSNNIDLANTTQPEADLALTKQLTNPEDLALGATLNYQLQLTNNGPDPYNLRAHETPFSSLQLVSDIVPVDLIPTDLGAPGPIPGTSIMNNVGNSDLTCVFGTAASGISAFVGLTTNASNYGLIVCWYTAGTNYALADGATIDLSIDFVVQNDSDLAFVNFGLAVPNGWSSDPNEGDMNDAFTSGNDVLDELTQNYLGSLNNFAHAPLSSDVSVTTNLVNPQDVAPGSALYYDVILENKGPANLDLAHYATISSPLFGGLYDGAQFSLIGSETAGISCLDFGPGSAAFLGAAASEHPSYQAFSCGYSGGGSVLVPVGTSTTIRLRVDALQSLSSNFTFYALNTTIFGDPDLPSLGTDLFGATEDVIDTLSNDNFSRFSSTYTPSSLGGGNNNSSALSSTGLNQNLLIISGAVALLLSVGLYRVRHKILI